jgi:carbon-monoxide dehydrogenase large subunit
MTEQLDAGLVAGEILEHPDAMSSPVRRRRARPRPAPQGGRQLVTGQTNWTDNITLPGLLHMAVLRSPMAHARIVSVDVSGASRCPA